MRAKKDMVVGNVTFREYGKWPGKYEGGGASITDKDFDVVRDCKGCKYWYKDSFSLGTCRRHAPAFFGGPGMMKRGKNSGK